METPEKDGLYEKYRVFKEPEEAEQHPTMMTAYFDYGPEDVRVGMAEEVMDFVFVLKPSTDHHARVALAAYCLSVADEKPQLAEDLWEILGDLKDQARTYPL